jgi:hypothetical protein
VTEEAPDGQRASSSINRHVLTGPTFSTREIYNADRNAVPRVIEERRSGGVSNGKGLDMARVCAKRIVATCLK